jgi:hypothetical protein
MKKLILLLMVATFCLTLSVSGVAAPIYVYDGGKGQGGTWWDVNKASVNGPPDSLLCWAAAAADAIAWTGWYGWDSGTSTLISTADAIYGTIEGAWPNTTGSPTYAYEWWMTDRTQSIIPTKIFPTAGLDFYPTVHVQDGNPASVTAFVQNSAANTIYDFLGTYITADRGIVASIDVPGGPGLAGPYSHAVTVWGWDPTAGEIYLTDSDDGLTALRTYDFFQSGGQVFIHNYSNLYTNPTDVEITQLTRLNLNDSGIQPNQGGGTTQPVPEPSTIFLIGTGLTGLVALWRRKTS